MGCLKITYRNNFEHLKVSFRKELSLKNSIEKAYGALELKNHLGSVLVTISDRKILEDINGNNVMDTEDHYISDVISYADYYAFGMVMPGRNGNTSEMSYGYQGSEKDNEIKGNNNSYTTHFRQLDPRLGRWLSIDPLASSMPWQSPYCSMDNNPIWFNDPMGDEVEGDFYNKSGKFLASDGKNDDKVYVEIEQEKILLNFLPFLQQVKINTNLPLTGNFKELSIGKKEFEKQASTIYAESSAFKENTMTTGLKKEMFGIASVHQKNSLAFGIGTPKAKEFLALTPIQRNKSQFHTTANAAVINALTGGFDYSNGATFWDGAEQGMFKESDDRRSNGTFELHMNTMGWSISDAHYKAWKANIGSNFTSPQEKSAPANFGGYQNKGKKRLTSTAVHLQTIFWKLK